MNCEQIEPQLTAYLDKELTPKEEILVEIHLKECPQCRQDLENLRKCSLIIQEWDKGHYDVTTGPDYQEQILTRLSGRPKVNRWRNFFTLSKYNWKWEVATVAVLLLALIFVLFGHSPYAEYYIPQPGSRYSLKSAGQAEWVAPAADYRPRTGDAIKTASQQTAELKLPNKTIVKLAGDTEMVIKDREETGEVINLKGGKIYVETPDAPRPTHDARRIKVTTQAGDIIDKGTKFHISVTPDDSAVLVTVTVMEGQVLFTNPYGSALVNAGETAAASPADKPALQDIAPEAHLARQLCAQNKWQYNRAYTNPAFAQYLPHSHFFEVIQPIDKTTGHLRTLVSAADGRYYILHQTASLEEIERQEAVYPDNKDAALALALLNEELSPDYQLWIPYYELVSKVVEEDNDNPLWRITLRYQRVPGIRSVPVYVVGADAETTALKPVAESSSALHQEDNLTRIIILPHSLKPEIERLIGLLGNDDEQIREAATNKLIAIGRRAVPLVKEALNNLNQEIRMRARFILVSIVK